MTVKYVEAIGNEFEVWFLMQENSEATMQDVMDLLKNDSIIKLTIVKKTQAQYQKELKERAKHHD